MNVSYSKYGSTPDGQVGLYTISNNSGMVVAVTNYGAIITSIVVPDRDGKPTDVALGFDNLDQYLQKHPHFGGLIGRYGNRIGGAAFTIDGQRYTLAANNGENNLHGGPIGFDKYLHKGETFETEDTAGVIMSRVSPHMESGFPGALHYSVYYTLTDENELIITYEATTDQPTHVNLTNHTYFNLAGEGNGDILSTELMIKSSHLTAVNEQLIPTGELYPVAGTPFDFRSSKALGADIDKADPQLALGGGYDHNFVLDNPIHSTEHAATAYDGRSGIEMEMHTTEPGVQLFSANNLDGSLVGKSGKAYPYRGAFCLETQHYPNSPNNAEFPPTLLIPGQEYQSQTIYKFGVR